MELRPVEPLRLGSVLSAREPWIAMEPAALRNDRGNRAQSLRGAKRRGNLKRTDLSLASGPKAGIHELC